MNITLKKIIAITLCVISSISSISLPLEAANRRPVARRKAVALQAARRSGRSRAVARRTSRKAAPQRNRRTPVRKAVPAKGRKPQQIRRVAGRKMAPAYRGTPARPTPPAAVTPVNRTPVDSGVVIYERVPAQSGADCGYHALYNGWRKYEQVSNRPTPAFPLEQWKNLVRGMQQGAQKPMIDYEEMVPLANHSGIDPATYSIINDIEQFRFEPVQLASYPSLMNLSEIITRLRTTEGAFHAFIIGDMQHVRTASGSMAAIPGHWIAVLAQRVDNKIKYYVMDSMNGRPEDMVNALRNLIERPDLASLPRIKAAAELVNAIEVRIAEAQAALVPQGFFFRRPNFEKSLEVLEELSWQLTPDNKALIPTGYSYINRIMSILEDIERQPGNPYEDRIDALREALLR